MLCKVFVADLSGVIMVHRVTSLCFFSLIWFLLSPAYYSSHLASWYFSNTHLAHFYLRAFVLPFSTTKALPWVFMQPASSHLLQLKRDSHSL